MWNSNLEKKEIQPGKSWWLWQGQSWAPAFAGGLQCLMAVQEGYQENGNTDFVNKKNLVSWFRYQGRGFFWTGHYSPTRTFLYVWRWALHCCCKFYEMRYIISCMKLCESGSSLQSSNFPAKEQEQFTVKSTGTCLFSQICGILASLPVFRHLHLPNTIHEQLYWPHFSGMTCTPVPARLEFALVKILDFSVAIFI